MQSCLGIYIESNLLKYAKVSKEKDEFKVDAYGIKFFDDLNKTIKNIIEETYSFSTPISINLLNEKYMYYDIFSLLSKNDIQKTIQTEYETFCAENRYNPKAFETRYALVPSVEDKEKIKVIHVLSNKIELNKQKQYLEKYRLTKIVPIGTAISSIAEINKKENALIVNMEEKTTITTILDRSVYNVETLDFGSEEILEKINLTENSMNKAYEICRQTTIYTSNVISEEKDQPYLEEIITTLYQICQRIQQIINESHVKISKVYLTGTLAVVNNIDLYFQEILTSVDCKILKPSIIEEKVKQINIKDYIEVNSAIALAMQALGEGVQALNFAKARFSERLKKALNADVSFEKLLSKKDNFSESKSLTKTEIVLLRFLAIIVLMNIIFITFSKLLYKQMEKKEEEVEDLIAEERKEISNIKQDAVTINNDDTTYITKIEELKAINDRIENIAKEKNSIPNLLNQIMYVIPEEVQIITIKHVTNDTESTTADASTQTQTTNNANDDYSDGSRVRISARAKDYEQLGYFIAKLKVEGILLDVISSSSQKNADFVDVTIEGELP